MTSRSVLRRAARLGRSVGRFPIPSDCRIVPAGEYGDEDQWNDLGFDLWQAAETVDSIFEQQGIRPSRAEEVALAVVCGDVIVGGATLGHVPSEEAERAWTFSVAIDKGFQQKHLGRALIAAVMRFAHDQEEGRPTFFHVWVVNPNAAKILSSMGFDAEGRGGEWYPDAPHMSFWMR